MYHVKRKKSFKRETVVEILLKKRRIRDVLKKAWLMFRNPSPGDFTVVCCSQIFGVIEIWDWWAWTSDEWAAALLVLLSCLWDAAEPTWLSYAGTSSFFRGRVRKRWYFPSFKSPALKQAHCTRGSVWTYDSLQWPKSICLHWESSSWATHCSLAQGHNCKCL